ncbi:MAG: hypothetical protein Q8M11_21510 [Sulfuritalea sp.]|jgi:hypothetical protein|nr:hypothetical protein [Sulfuritalea sp.]MDP1983561.1 hypothetical protein [Sulfuritalea sp.]
MKRRTKVSQAALVISPGSRSEGGIRLGETQGLVAAVPNKTTTVTLRLSGQWHVLWARLKASVPDVSDAELLRQGVALRMALAAVDGKGQKPKAFIQFHDQAGKLTTVDLEEHVGIRTPEDH